MLTIIGDSHWQWSNRGVKVTSVHTVRSRQLENNLCGDCLDDIFSDVRLKACVPGRDCEMGVFVVRSSFDDCCLPVLW
jgi:hypothetical protein